MQVSARPSGDYLSLGTYRRSGQSVDTPVWFAEQDGRLYVFTAGSAGKVKRLRNSPQARVASCDMRGQLRGEWQDARARLVEDTPTIEAAYRALRAKYGMKMRITDFFSTLTGRIRERKIIEIELV